mmetsp:Transcript_25097/g.70306  ORF Transcript_25097/g.70306 Transcript_25097/m.70306 type:complete len:203 (-) Transcript_25097:270-878(-)
MRRIGRLRSASDPATRPTNSPASSSRGASAPDAPGSPTTPHLPTKGWKKGSYASGGTTKETWSTLRSSAAVKPYSIWLALRAILALGCVATREYSSLASSTRPTESRHTACSSSASPVWSVRKGSTAAAAAKRSAAWLSRPSSCSCVASDVSSRTSRSCSALTMSPAFFLYSSTRRRVSASRSSAAPSGSSACPGLSVLPPP